MPKTICVHCGHSVPKRRIVDGASRGDTPYGSEPYRGRATAARITQRRRAKIDRRIRECLDLICSRSGRSVVHRQRGDRNCARFQKVPRYRHSGGTRRGYSRRGPRGVVCRRSLLASHINVIEFWRPRRLAPWRRGVLPDRFQMDPTTASHRNASESIVNCVSAMTIRRPYRS